MSSVAFPLPCCADLERKLPSHPQSHWDEEMRFKARYHTQKPEGVLQLYSSHQTQIFRAVLSLASLKLYAHTKSDSFPKYCRLRPFSKRSLAATHYRQLQAKGLTAFCKAPSTSPCAYMSRCACLEQLAGTPISATVADILCQAPGVTSASQR